MPDDESNTSTNAEVPPSVDNNLTEDELREIAKFVYEIMLRDIRTERERR